MGRISVSIAYERRQRAEIAPCRTAVAQGEDRRGARVSLAPSKCLGSQVMKALSSKSTLERRMAAFWRASMGNTQRKLWRFRQSPLSQNRIL